MKPVNIFSGAVLLVVLLGCSSSEKSGQNRFSTFYWKTTFALGAEERAWMDSLGSRHLYVKIADIASDGAYGSPQPSALLEVSDTTGVWRYEITPAVFLTNSVFSELPIGRAEWLASAVAGLYANYVELYPSSEQAQTLLLDCDWTERTREAYFDFLQRLKRRLPPETLLIATLRLHQYKFPERTGVPPVDRVLLMAYNTGDIGDWRVDNSILELRELEKYLYPARRYPLPLDPALPLFAWSLAYRDGQLWKILPALSDRELNADTAHFEPMAGRAGCFIVKKGTFRDGHYLREGDWIRFEAISPDLLQKAAHALRAIPLPPDAEWGLFHLNRACIMRHDASRLLSNLR